MKENPNVKHYQNEKAHGEILTRKNGKVTRYNKTTRKTLKTGKPHTHIH